MKPLIINRGSDVFESLIDRMVSRYDLNYRMINIVSKESKSIDENIRGHDVIIIDGDEISYDLKKQIINSSLKANDNIHLIFISEDIYNGEKEMWIETYSSHNMDISKVDKDRSSVVDKVYDILRCGPVTENKSITEKKDLFYKSIFHFIRDKNQIVQGYLQLLEEEDLEEGEIELLDKASNTMIETQEIFKKTEMLVKIAKDCSEKKVSLNIMIDRAIVFNQVKAKARGIDIKYEDSDIYVKCSYILEYLFKNLIENAIYHSSGSLISISIIEDSEMVTVKVEDDGKGVEEDHGRIFDMGYKSNGSTGSGVGLFLVKEIVDICEGHIEIKRSELGGARFDVTLKKA